MAEKCRAGAAQRSRRCHPPRGQGVRTGVRTPRGACGHAVVEHRILKIRAKFPSNRVIRRKTWRNHPEMSFDMEFPSIGRGPPPSHRGAGNALSALRREENCRRIRSAAPYDTIIRRLFQRRGHFCPRSPEIRLRTPESKPPIGQPRGWARTNPEAGGGCL